MHIDVLYAYYEENIILEIENKTRENKLSVGSFHSYKSLK